MIFHSPSTFSNVNKSVYRLPFQLSSSSRTVATVLMRSMLAIRVTYPFRKDLPRTAGVRTRRLLLLEGSGGSH